MQLRSRQPDETSTRAWSIKSKCRDFESALTLRQVDDFSVACSKYAQIQVPGETGLNICVLLKDDQIQDVFEGHEVLVHDQTVKFHAVLV
jgi:hypothetical protein